jgi:hypothetical protein
MKSVIDKKLIESCIKANPWDLGNKVLYDLCSRHFTHDSTEKVIAKVWLIGRSYAVAIERRRNKKDINDSFYIDHVAPAFKKSQLDVKLNSLKGSSLNIDTLKKSFELHGYLTKLLYELTELEKRSFSSKYLHFHLPALFYIYDTRAVDALRGFITRVPKELEHLLDSDTIDNDYAKFACKCFFIQQLIYQQVGKELSTRELDNLLIEVANNKLSAKAISSLKKAGKTSA